MLKIETKEEIYIINTNNILYINIYENYREILTLEINMKNNENITLDEEDLSRKEIMEIIEKIKYITI